MVEVTVARALSLALARGGPNVAIYFGDTTLTYAELDQRSNRVANALLSLGLQRGDRVSVVMPNCPDYVVVGIACAKAALTMVTLNYRFTAGEHARQITDCGARVLVYSETYRAVVDGADAELESSIRRICVGRAAGKDVSSLDKLEQLASDALPPVVPRPEDLFYLGYTSGTTGKPKGAMVTQFNRALAYHYWALEFGVGSSDVIIHTGPFHHTAPFTFVLTQLFLGGQVVILDRFDPVGVARAVERHCVTWGFFVPFMLDRLVEAEGDISRFNLSSLRFLISGAAPLPTVTKDKLLKTLPGVGLHEFYGATEAGVISNLRPADQKRKVRCVGRPVFDTEIEIRDESRVKLPRGEVGDIWMRGPTIFDGYFQSPERNKEVFDGDWCTLGDVGRMDEEGYLYILDRRKDVIKSGGVNVFPAEIEEVLLTHPDVVDAAVVGVPDAMWGEAVHAVLVLTNGRTGSPIGLEALCRTKLAGYKVPKSFEWRAELPRNANGKVLKRQLRGEYVTKNSASFLGDVP